MGVTLEEQIAAQTQLIEELENGHWGIKTEEWDMVILLY